MTQTKSKICGIVDVNSAKFAAMAGADFVGLVFEPKSPRFISKERAKKIVDTISNMDCVPVAVFTEHNAISMNMILSFTGIKVAQLHGKISRDQHTNLQSDISRIFVLPFADSQSIPDDLDPKRDYLLYDSQTPGVGKAFPKKDFQMNPKFRCFIAGGVNPSNVSEIIESFHPYGVDVSTGVESSPGVKDLSKLKSFVTNVEKTS